MSYIYLASPYSSDYGDNPNLPNMEGFAQLMEDRFLQAEACAAKLLKEGQHIHSPIVHCHALAKKYDLPKDVEYWWSYNSSMIAGARGFAVLKLPGWDESKGVLKEIDYFQSLHPNSTLHPIQWIEPEEFLGAAYGEA